MAITIACPCGKQLRVNDSFAGKRVKCPQCSQVSDVPKATLPEPTPLAPAAETGYSFADEHAAGPSAPPADAPESQNEAPKSEGWKNMPAGVGKVAFLATPARGKAYKVAVEQEAKAQAALYSGCAFIVMMFFWKGGFYGGVGMLILVSIFLVIVKVVEFATAKHFARKMKQLRKASMNPSNFGGAFEPCESPSCDICRAALQAPQGSLLTTTQVVKSARFWRHYWQVHQQRIQAICKAHGWRFPSFRLLAAKYEQMQSLHFIFERITKNRQPWLVCDECLGTHFRLASADRDQAAALAEPWWGSAGKFSPLDAGPASPADIDVGKTIATINFVGSLTMMIAGAVPILAGVAILFAPSRNAQGPSSPMTAALICVIIGVTLVLGGYKWWKSF